MGLRLVPRSTSGRLAGVEEILGEPEREFHDQVHQEADEQCKGGRPRAARAAMAKPSTTQNLSKKDAACQGTRSNVPIRDAVPKPGHDRTRYRTALRTYTVVLPVRVVSQLGYRHHPPR